MASPWSRVLSVGFAVGVWRVWRLNTKNSQAVIPKLQSLIIIKLSLSQTLGKCLTAAADQLERISYPKVPRIQAGIKYIVSLRRGRKSSL